MKVLSKQQLLLPILVFREKVKEEEEQKNEIKVRDMVVCIEGGKRQTMSSQGFKIKNCCVGR